MRNKLTKDERDKFKRDCISFLDEFIDYLHEDEINNLTSKDIILQNYISIHETKKQYREFDISITIILHCLALLSLYCSQPSDD